MKDIIALGFLIGSFSGISALVFKKIPELRKIKADQSPRLTFETSSLKGAGHRFKNWLEDFFKRFSWQTIVQKILSQIRIAALKVERKTGEWLSRARKKSRKRKEREAYWKKLSHLADKEED